MCGGRLLMGIELELIIGGDRVKVGYYGLG